VISFADDGLYTTDDGLYTTDDGLYTTANLQILRDFLE
jgi:hypothetical protein